MFYFQFLMVSSGQKLIILLCFTLLGNKFVSSKNSLRLQSVTEFRLTCLPRGAHLYNHPAKSTPLGVTVNSSYWLRGVTSEHLQFSISIGLGEYSILNLTLLLLEYNFRKFKVSCYTV